MNPQQTTPKAFVAITAALILSPFVIDAVIAQDERASVPPHNERGQHLFILSGQSNMVGLKHEESFFPAVAEAFGKDRVLVVKNANSGQSIRSWCKSNHESPPPTTGRVPKVRGELYDPLINKVKTAIEGQTLETVTFIWMQGESDLNNTAYDAYLKELLEQLEADLAFKEINLVIGRISDAGLDNEKRLEGRLNIRRIQKEFAEAHPRGAWVDTDDLNDRKQEDGKIVNDLHYTPEGSKVLGQRFAENAIALIKANAQTQDEEAKPALELGAPFSDHAVLQQQVKVPVWGTSLPGARVTVSFDGQTKTADADKDGSWRVELDPMDAVKLQSVNDCPKGKTMAVVSEKDGTKSVREIKDLIIGDVWLCAGQSNMAGKMRTTKSRHFPEDSIEKANYPALRQMISGQATSWLVCSPETAPEIKKVAFFFGRRLQQDALVPVGLIGAAVGGSKIESWLNQQPYPTGGIHTELIEPLVGYGLRGALWYQGESNANDRRHYQPKLESLITGWRKVWNQGEFPVYFVQLPGIGMSSLDHPAGGDGRAEIRQASVETLKLKNTGLAVTIDVGAKGEHPPNKYDTGVRLARLALHRDYGFTDLSPCPLYKNHAIENGTIRISFDHAQGGLMIARKEGFAAPTPTPDAKLQWLSIQARDGIWHWAEGHIDGSELVVSSKEVDEPIAVRYAYTQHPEGHLLYNQQGQPVSPFSTIGYGPEPRDDEKPRKR